MTIPEDRVIEVSEAEAAAVFRERSAARSVEFLEWVEEHPADSKAPEVSE